MLRIGEFSALSQVTVKTLRYYDDVGVLKPVRVDADSGYRYYSAGQLAQLHRILALKDLGLSLEQIACVLKQGVSVDELRGMLLLRRVEQQDRVRDELETLSRVNARLHLIELEGKMCTAVVFRHVEPQWLASLREPIPAYREIRSLIGRARGLMGSLNRHGPGVVLIHDEDFKDERIDAEAGVYVPESTAVSPPLRAYQLPAVDVAAAIHHGPFNRVAETYESLLRWIEANGYHKSGPTRELFLHVSVPVTREDPSNVTEIQVPVKKE
jgi:DNA-binding transcriptional MerR regulator